MQRCGYFVDRVGVQRGDHRFRGNVGEKCDLAPVAVCQWTVGTTEHDVRLNTDLPQFLDGMLRRLGLHFAGCRNIRDQGQVDITDVVAAEINAELTNRFQKRQRLDVADRAADLDHGDFRLTRAGGDPTLDFVGDVRNDLDRATEIVAATFLADDTFVDLPCREIVALGHLHIGEAFVVAEIEIRFCPVFGDENFTVLKRAHRARVNVDVGVELEIGDTDAAGGEDRGQRRGGDALPERGNDAASHENELGHKRQVLEIGSLPEPSLAHKRAAGGSTRTAARVSGVSLRLTRAAQALPFTPRRPMRRSLVSGVEAGRHPLLHLIAADQKQHGIDRRCGRRSSNQHAQRHHDLRRLEPVLSGGALDRACDGVAVPRHLRQFRLERNQRRPIGRIEKLGQFFRRSGRLYVEVPRSFGGFSQRRRTIAQERSYR